MWLAVTRRHLVCDAGREATQLASMCVRLSAPLSVDRLGDLPEQDPDDRHRLGGDELLVVERGTLGLPLGEELVLARLPPQQLAELIGGAPGRGPSGPKPP